MNDGVGAVVGGDVITIVVVGVPMPVYLEASEHGDELMREFALMAGGSRVDAEGDEIPPEADVPARLTALVEELRARFAGFTLRPEAELAQAAARGDAAIDVVYRVPQDAARSVAALDALLDEADEFCRTGELLTLATPPEAVDFRRWFLGEFVRQADGHPPTAWADWKP